MIALHVQKHPTEPFGFVGFFSPESAAVLSQFYRSSGCEVELKAIPPFSLGGPCVPPAESSAGASEVVGSYVTPYFSLMVRLLELLRVRRAALTPPYFSPTDWTQGESGE